MKLALLTLSAIMAVGSMPVAEANTTAQPGQQSIYLVRVDRPKENVANGSMVRVAPTIINTGHPLHKISIEIALSSNGDPVQSIVYDNQTLGRSEEETFALNTMPLSPGTYTVDTIVSDGKGAVLAELPMIGSIVVSP